MNESASGTKVGVRTLRISALVVAMILASCSTDATTEPKHPPLPTDGSVPAGRPFSFEVGSHRGVGFLGLPVDGRCGDGHRQQSPGGNVSDETKAARPEVPWRDMIGTRIILAHAYFHIDQDIIGRVVHRNVPILRDQLEAVAASIDVG